MLVVQQVLSTSGLTVTQVLNGMTTGAGRSGPILTFLQE